MALRPPRGPLCHKMLPPVQIVAYGLPKNLARVCDKDTAILPVFTVLAVVFIWQSGKVMWRAVFSAIFRFFLFYILDFVNLDYKGILMKNSIELTGI
jgi:ABC-type uncharacterized transport system permease subunit